MGKEWRGRRIVVEIQMAPGNTRTIDRPVEHECRLKAIKFGEGENKKSYWECVSSNSKGGGVGIDGGTSVDFQTGNKVGGQGCNRLFFCQSAANRGTMCESKRETAFSAGWCVCKREKKVMVQVSSVETPSIRGTRSWESLTKGNGAERFQVGKQWEQLMQVN